MSLIFRKAQNLDIGVIKMILQNENLPYQDIDLSNIELFLAFDATDFVGIVGLEKFADIVLLRSMVVLDGFRAKGYGRKICNQILQMAKNENIIEVFLLTCSAKDFFEHLGFEVIERKYVPDSIKSTTEFSGLCPESAMCMQFNL